MPQNLTGNPSSFPTQTAPIGGDPRTAASVATPLQNAADRAEYLKERILYIDPDKTGVRKFRSVTGAASDVRAITDHTNGDYILWASFGVWLRYESTATAVDDGVLIIKPDDTVTGRWICDEYLGSNIASRAARLDSAGKVPTTLLTDAPKEVTLAGAVTQPTTNSSTYSSLSDMSATVTSVVSGNLIEVKYEIQLVGIGAGGVAVRPKYTRNSSTTNIYNELFLAQPTLGDGLFTGTLFVPTDFTGSWTIAWDWRAPSSNTTTVGRRYMRVRVLG